MTRRIPTMRLPPGPIEGTAAKKALRDVTEDP